MFLSPMCGVVVVVGFGVVVAVVGFGVVVDRRTLIPPFPSRPEPLLPALTCSLHYRRQ